MPRTGSGCDVVFSGLVEVLATASDLSDDDEGKQNGKGLVLELLLSVRADNDSIVYINNYKSLPVRKSTMVTCNTSRFSSTKKCVLIELDQYLTAIGEILITETMWSIYSLILTNFEAQLKSAHLFYDCIGGITALRGVLCEIVTQEKALVSVTNVPSQFKKSDVYVSALKLLAALVPYGSMTRQESDDVIQAFQLGLQRWPSAARLSLHFLTLALIELPANMTRHLPSILMKVSRITSSAMAPHKLEFLSILARYPQLYVNCTDADFKRVFGIALQHIQMPSGGTRSTLSHYVVQMAYHVVTTWFSSLKLVERRKYVPFIIKYMMPGSSSEEPVLDESIELILDVLIMNTFSDCSPRPPEVQAGVNARLISEKTWAYGNGIVTMRTGAVEGLYTD
ncbi:Tuberous sclerosis 2-like protein [Irineochytrium annulatum]|nr:Tuberous sclerosis 2-like protein [Irineochytrium annulatum]